MSESIEQLKTWVNEMAQRIAEDQDPDPDHYTYFVKDPMLALQLVLLIKQIDESQLDDNRSNYSACIFALDICVAQLQSAIEGGNKSANKILKQLMSSLAEAISEGCHTLNFWLPILNAFYDVNVELSDELKQAYFDLAHDEDEFRVDEEWVHLNSIRDLITELSDLSVFDIAEHFFAQSYAMPADFFSDLVADLYSIDEGHEIALLTLLHPKQEVRDVVIATHEQLLPSITLSSVSLSRLLWIKNWYPESYHTQINRWIKDQRKKGVVFMQTLASPKSIRIKASEVDGSGAQGVFIHLQKNRKHRLCGLLYKQYVGIKDAWITPVIARGDVTRYYDDAFDDSVMLRDVDLTYLQMMSNHFLSVTIQQGGMPDLHLLEIQEELGMPFLPQALDVPYLIEQLAVQITPFTDEHMNASLKRSKTWPKNKRFTESWYMESFQIDKLVNRCSSFIDGIKVCRFEEAMQAVFEVEMEQQREHWLLHFLWITLWLKAKCRKNEMVWQDSLFIVYAIQSGKALKDIPIMKEICRESVINSIETMQERRTHLNQE
jgi:hypothetical protein